MARSFTACIYKDGINAVIDVPARVTDGMVKVKGYIRAKGTINGTAFAKNLVPVRNAPYRLHVDMVMLKAAQVVMGDTAKFIVEQDTTPEHKLMPPVPKPLLEALRKNELEKTFRALSPSRRKEILRYLNFLKSKETLNKHIARLVAMLKGPISKVRVP
jgi:hypothetical protein